jgi:WD40 repeat protein
VAGGKQLLTIGPVQGLGGRLVFSPDGRRLAAGAGGGLSGKAGVTVKVWDAETGDEMHSFPSLKGILVALAFTDGGRRLAADTRDRYTVWEVANGAEVGGFPHSPWEIAAIMPGGTRLASAGSEGRGVTVWDTATGQQVLALPGFGGWATSLTFSPDGHRLAAGGIEGQKACIRIWNATPRAAEAPATPAGP